MSLKLPDGFIWLARTGYAIPFAHVATKKFGAIPAAIVLTCEVNQAELDYQIAKLLREIEKDAAYGA